MATNPPADLFLQPLTGKGFPLSGWLVQYQLLLVALDPFTNESAWLFPTTVRLLHNFEQSDARVGVILAGADADESRQFLGPHTKNFLCFPDPSRSIVKGFGFATVPAIVHVASDGSVVNSAEGWEPEAWQSVTDELARMLRWTGPVLPDPRDPGAFAGTKAS